MGLLDIVISSCVWRIPKGAMSPVDAALINGTDNFLYGNSPILTPSFTINSPSIEAPFAGISRTTRARMAHGAMCHCCDVSSCHERSSLASQYMLQRVYHQLSRDTSPYLQIPVQLTGLVLRTQC